MSTDAMNELTFSGWLAEFTATRAKRFEAAGRSALIASAAIEERQVDAAGRVRRCDLRFNTAAGRKLASGELKRPEVAEGRDPRNGALRSDARRKAMARGLPYYFTCNIASVVLYAIPETPAEDDAEVGSFELAPIGRSGQAIAYRVQIEKGWNEFRLSAKVAGNCRIGRQAPALSAPKCSFRGAESSRISGFGGEPEFLNALEGKLTAIGRTRPTVTNEGVIAIRDALYAVANEVLPRAMRRVLADPTLAEELRNESSRSFNFPASLQENYPDRFREELIHMLRFGIFVVTQKLILYRVLEDAGPRRSVPYNLDPLTVTRTSTDPRAVRNVLDQAFSLAMRRSKDYETAFEPQPFVGLVFSDPEGPQEATDCQIGEVWDHLLTAVKNASWLSISQNIVGLLYEVIVEERFRHQLGQFYTREDVVDLLTTFAIRAPGDIVLDPATGGGSFLRSAYHRKRSLGEAHGLALATIWGTEITAFAAELSTVTLATSDTHEPAAYPRVLLCDFFDLRPGLRTELEIPGELGRLQVPVAFDAVVGNPPYISSRHLTNQNKIINALATASADIVMPRFTGKSDAYAYFIVHATQFLKNGGRLSFVVSSAILFSDYGIPLIRFIGKHYRICAIVDSMAERWFPDADTNTVLLMLEREENRDKRAKSQIRFVRLRRPLSQLLPDPGNPKRRDSIESLLDVLLDGQATEDDPRMQVNVCEQGDDGGLEISADEEAKGLLDEEEDE